MSDTSPPGGSGRWGDDVEVVNQKETLAGQGRAVAALGALRNGRETPELDDDTAAALGEYVSNRSTRSAMRDRIKQARQLGVRGLHGPGQSHNGRRDYWETFGYPDPRSLSPEDYETRAKTQDIASIVTESPVAATWKYPPQIRDDGREEGDDPTDFEQDIQRLLDGSIGSLDAASERSGINTYWEWADRKQRPVQFGLLFMGYRDGREMSQPVNESAIDGPDDLAYCNVFSQTDVTNWATADDFDRGDAIRDGIEAPNKPILYEIEFETSSPDGTIDVDERIVHHSRVHHVIEKPGRSEYLGRSCLRPILHRLIDFEKAYGSAAEAHYSNVDRKFIGMGEGSGPRSGQRDTMIEQFDENMTEMLDGMRSTAYTENMDMEVIGGESVDPSGLLDSLFPPIAGVSGQPQRIMKGSERGDLASSQDESNWASRIQERQEGISEPRLVRPTVDDWIRFGVVSEPVHEENSYSIHWPSQFELTELEEAEKSKSLSQALKNVHDAVSMGADEEAAYEAASLPHPDTDGETGAGDDPAVNIDEADEQIREHFDQITDHRGS